MSKSKALHKDTNKKLDQLIAEQATTNQLLRKILQNVEENKPLNNKSPVRYGYPDRYGKVRHNDNDGEF